jgi:hypothetical protein
MESLRIQQGVDHATYVVVFNHSVSSCPVTLDPSTIVSQDSGPAPIGCPHVGHGYDPAGELPVYGDHRLPVSV